MLDQRIGIDTLVVCFEYNFDLINYAVAQYQELGEFYVGCSMLAPGQ